MGAFTESITALLPLLQKLQWQEKVTLIQILAAELAGQDNTLLLSKQAYPVWTPLDAFEASDVLTQLLNESVPQQAHG